MVDMPPRARFPSYYPRFPLFAGSVRLVVNRGLAKQRARQIYKNLLLIHLFEFITAATEVKRSGTTLMI